MADSSLVTYEKYTKNCTKMADKVNKYLLPHVYVGQVTTVNGVNHFATDCGASCQYVIGTDGTVGQSVKESDRSWCTGGDKKVVTPYGKFVGGSNAGCPDYKTIDCEAITFEMACDPKAPYALNNNVRATLVLLMADCAKRNGMGELKWKADVNLVGNPDEQNVLVHRWFATKSCPGDWTYNQLGAICDEANAINGYVTNYKIYDKGAAPQPVPLPVTKTIADPVIKKGATGENARLLQKNLNVFGYHLAEDGVIGQLSIDALMGWQRATGLVPDGSYGPASYAKMKALLNK